MAAEYAKFEEDYPIIRPPAIESSAKGDEALATTFGSISNALFEKGEALAKDASAAMYMQSRTEMEKVQNQAQVQMLQNPGNAKKIADNTAMSLQNITKSAIVNKENRRQLEYDAQSSIDSMQLEGARQSIEQNRLIGKYTFYTNLPTMLETYQESLKKNPEQAQALQDNFSHQVRGLVATRVISPKEGASIFQLMHGAADHSKLYMEMANDPKIDAVKYNTAQATGFSSGTTGNSKLVVEGGTNHLYSIQSGEQSFKQVKEDIFDGKMPDYNTFINGIKDPQRYEARRMHLGIAQALGMINANVPITQIKSTIEDLNSKGENLSYTDSAKLHKLQQYIKQLNNGDYLDAQSETAAGSRIIQQNTAHSSAIQSSPEYTTTDDHGNVSLNASGQQAMQKNSNDGIRQLIALGVSQHIPSALINPIPRQTQMTVEQGWQKGSDPSIVLSINDYFDKDVAPYLSQSLKNPVQAAALDFVNNLRDSKDQAFRLSVIQDNQTGMLSADDKNSGKGYDFSVMKLGNNGKSAEFLRNAIIADPAIKTFLNYQAMLQTPGVKIPAFSEMALNCVRGEAFRNNDLALAKYPDYVSNFSKRVTDAYHLMSGPGWIVNSKLYPSVTSDQWSKIAAMYINKANQRIADKNNVSYDQVNQTFDTHPLTMILTPFGHVQIMSQSGVVPGFDLPYSDNMISASNKYFKQLVENKIGNYPTPAHQIGY